MMDFNFGLGEDIDLLRESVHAFAADRIASRAVEIDAKNEFPRDLWPELGELGLLGTWLSCACCRYGRNQQGISITGSFIWRTFEFMCKPAAALGR